MKHTFLKKEIFLAAFIYFVTIFILLIVVYRFLENWHLSTFNVFIAGGLVLLVSMGWGYVISMLFLSPKKQRDDTLLMLTKDIIHELNIPLSTIKANSELLRREESDDKVLKRIQRIDAASERLEKLYHQLVYTIEKEIQEIDKEIVDIQHLITERIDILSMQKRYDFKIDIASYVMQVDKIGFEQMVDNILINAMKYSLKNSLIFISLNDDTLCIEDQGIGMSTSELLRVYERYFQSDDTSKGQGIGLSLVKKYCDSENIDIRIHSQKELGTKVCLNLRNVKVNLNALTTP